MKTLKICIAYSEEDSLIIRSLFFLINILFCISSEVYAQTEPLEKAREAAAIFFEDHSRLQSKRVKNQNNVVKADPTLAFSSRSKSKNTLFVFNHDSISNGFVIVGDGDNAIRILGYSDNVRFDYDKAPDALKWLMNEYCRNGILKVPSTPSRKDSIPPLISTKWDQKEPYNCAIPSMGAQYMPFVTGCTATAMAQVMKYYGHPTHGKGSKQYTINYNDGTIPINFYADFENTYYDWNNMLDDYTDSYNIQQAYAVGQLMYHAGVSENTLYSPTLSNADSRRGAMALIENFRYDKSLSLASREYYTDEEWENIIYNELLNGRPVLYSGVDDDSIGHEFICHGFDAEMNLYAINWGWGGLYDGYFVLSGKQVLDPYYEAPTSYQREMYKIKEHAGEIDYSISYYGNKVDCDKKPNLKFKFKDSRNDKKEVKGLVADGVSSIKIDTQGEPASKCHYSCHWELLENIGTLSNENTWDAVYTAPEDFPQNEEGESCKVKARLTLTNGRVTYKQDVEITIYRVPVLLVHGLGDNGGSLSKHIGKHLKKNGYTDKLIEVVDYEDSHNEHFISNGTVVGTAANNAIDRLDGLKIVCSKVDVVGHSMGGLLTKISMKEGTNLFHKVITLNTPHGGSQFGNLMTDPIIEQIVDYTRRAAEDPDENDNEANPVLRRAFLLGYNQFLPNRSRSLRDGAVYDLGVDGSAINNLNIPMGNIKCHSIITIAHDFDSDFGAQNGKLNILVVLRRVLGYDSLADFLNDLFNGQPSDMIVPENSQRGGLSDEHSSTIRFSTHLQSYGNNIVQSQIVNLLKSSTKSPLFGSGFNTTPPIEYTMEGLKGIKELYPVIFDENGIMARKNDRRSQEIRDGADLKINTSYEDGDSVISVVIDNAYLYDNVSFACFTDDNIISYQNQSEGVVNLPKHINSDLIIMCEGKQKNSNNWVLYSDTLRVNNIASADLSKIEFAFDTLYVKKDETERVDIICYWNDGTITMLDSAKIDLRESNIASLNSNIRVLGQSVGSTIIEAFYLDKTCKSAVCVFDENAEIVDDSETDEKGYVTNQTIYYNIKPDEGGAYVVRPACKDNVYLYKYSGDSPVVNVSVDRSKSEDANFYYYYIPYNDGLANAKFRYGIIARNIINGNSYHKYGGSTDNLSGSLLPPGSFYGDPICVSFNSSIIPYNGIYDILPAYSIDGGESWNTMQYKVDQELPRITITGGENAERVDLPISISSNLVQVGKTAKITYGAYYTGNITFESLNPSMAIVDANGLIQALSEGIVSFKVVVEGDNNYLPRELEVVIEVVKHITSPLVLDIANNEISLGETTQILIPDDYHGVINYFVNPNGIADVSPSGLITCLAAGDAVITATSSATYDYYETINALSIKVSPTNLHFEDDLCILKQPTVGTENVISEGNSTMSVVLYNNSDDDIDNATLYYRIYLDGGGYVNHWVWQDLKSGSSFTYNFDVLSLKEYMTPGGTYTCKFFKDPNYSQPMNIESVTFSYGVEEEITFEVDEKCYATISLPFDSKIPIGLQAFEVKAFFNNSLALREVHSLERNHSYILYGNGKQYRFKGVKIPCLNNPRDGFMVGLQNDLSIPKDSYIIENNCLKKLNENREGLRWSAYFDLPKYASNEVNIQTATSLDRPGVYENKNNNSIYNIDGMLIPQFRNGINIIRSSDGITHKTLIK